MENMLAALMNYRKNVNELKFLLVECLAVLKTYPECREICRRIDDVLGSMK